MTFIVFHVHWDHIQGLPFFGPLYVNKQTGIKNSWTFLGGVAWQETAETCLHGQMNSPTFPVSWQEIRKITANMEFVDVYDKMVYDWKSSATDGLQITFGKLNHPQETYGTRFVFPDGKVIAYTTDNEPYDPNVPDPRLVQLARRAEYWITDCQYEKDQYHGMSGGVPRHGWGHSYPEAVAATAVQAEVKTVVLFHHDPESSDEKIQSVQDQTQDLIDGMMGGKGIKVIAAYEGLQLKL